MDRLAGLAINRIEQLETENDQLLARVRALKAGLREYGDHKPMCNRHFTPGSTPYERGCNCGYDALAGDVK